MCNAASFEQTKDTDETGKTVPQAGSHLRWESVIPHNGQQLSSKGPTVTGHLATPGVVESVLLLTGLVDSIEAKGILIAAGIY